MSHILVAGGAGFLGSNLVRELISRGDYVTVVDDLSTGSLANLSGLPAPAGSWDRRRVEDVIPDRYHRVDYVYHLASPASPPAYLARPIETLSAGSRGTEALLRLAEYHRATFVLASTSEVYGDSEVHPQPESYAGNVLTTSPRAVYDEAKRFSEALCLAWQRTGRVDVRIARIFNTCGPRMDLNDGRMIPQFIRAGKQGVPIPIYGDGSQTRSVCHSDDLIRGLIKLGESSVQGPVNLGNPDELRVSTIAAIVAAEFGGNTLLRFNYENNPDDPRRRCPDITRARNELGWSPRYSAHQAIKRTVEWYQ